MLSFSESLREKSSPLTGGCAGVEVTMGRCEEAGWVGVPSRDSNVSSAYSVGILLAVGPLLGEGALSLVVLTSAGRPVSSDTSSATEDEVRACSKTDVVCSIADLEGVETSITVSTAGSTLW